jgi:serine phosphatase RsbU (regulator of sigma subunit)
VIDCTGHGVPGAIMTMIAGSSFDLAVKDNDHREPSKILEHLNSLVKKALNQHYRESASNDGLDIGICFVSKADGHVVFSGAGIGLHYVADGMVHEVRPDRQSVGYKSSRLSFQYTDHIISVKATTQFYLSSDGMLDQTGGPRDLPFGKRRFKRLLLEYHQEPLHEQRGLFEEALETYRGDETQLDDVTVLGFVVGNRPPS